MQQSMPPNLQNFVNAEEVLFKMYSTRKLPWSKSKQLPMGGVVWLLGNLVFFGGWDDFGGFIMFSLMSVFFVLIGVAMIGVGIYLAVEEGGWMIGLKDRLVRYHKGRMTSYTWGQFTGNMELDIESGNLLLELRSGAMHKTGKQGGYTFVPDSVFLAGAPDVLSIERICRERIGQANGL